MSNENIADAQVADSLENAKAEEAPKATKKQITTEMLELDYLNGLNRKAIAAKYNVAVAVVNRWFKVDALKGIRPKKESEYELVVNTAPKEKKAKKVKEDTTVEIVNSPAGEDTNNTAPTAGI